MHFRGIRRWLVFVCMLSVILLPTHINAEQERITLEVVLTAGRNPNVNVVQDYGTTPWTEILTQEFQKEYPYVDLVFRTGSMEQMTVMIIGGKGPDIVNGMGHAFINLGRQGGFVDLKPLLEKDGIYEEVEQCYWPPQFEAFKHQEQLFGLPQYLGTIAMYYNADMFAAHGIHNPEPRADQSTMDWEDFEAIAKKLTQDIDGDGVTDVWGFTKWMTATDRIHYWMKAAGTDFYGNEEKTVSTLDNPQAIEALEFLQGLRWESQVMAPPNAPTSWLQSQAAIMEDGSWSLVSFLGLQKDGRPKVSFEWNLFPMPIGPSGERSTLATNDGYGINKNTKHPEEAYALLKFLAGPMANEIKAKYLALAPAHRDVAPEYLDLMRVLNMDVYDINTFVFTDAGAYAHPEVIYSDPMVSERAFKDAYTKIFDQGAPVGPTWSEAIAAMNRTLASTAQGPVRREVKWQGQDWISQDLNTAIPGSAVVQKDGKLVIEAAGADIWSYRDGFGFVYQEVAGDFEAVLCLHSAPDTDPWSKSGIMLRSEATAESANVTVLGTGKNGLVMQERQGVGDYATQVKSVSWTNGEPVYLKLIRREFTVTGQMSFDGKVWVTLGTVDIDLPEKVLVGPASTSHAATKTGKAVFSDWQLTPY
ncbi:MAG: extracellular solute-binding protein [Limnochordia bacterium]|nr:extracellular solute-binding protein [Limnochordia bacterium]